MLFAHGDVASVLLCAPNGLSLSKHRDVGAMANGEVRPLPERALADYSDFDARDTVYAHDRSRTAVRALADYSDFDARDTVYAS